MALGESISISFHPDSGGLLGNAMLVGQKLTSVSFPCSFDEARLIRQNEMLLRNGIDPSGVLSRKLWGRCVLNIDVFVDTGMPLDSKAITRL
jgi:hypothetical protein